MYTTDKHPLGVGKPMWTSFNSIYLTKGKSHKHLQYRCLIQINSNTKISSFAQILEYIFKDVLYKT